MSGEDLSELTADFDDSHSFEFVPCEPNIDAEEDSYDDSCSDDETKIRDNSDNTHDSSRSNLNISEDATLTHINDQFEGIDQNPAKSDPHHAVPSDELVESIVKQVEYYFSDENIVKDDYLLKLIRQNKAQFVSLAVIASFNKMKKLTKNCKDVVYAIEKASTKLILDGQQKRVKRIDPLPETPHRDFSDADRVVIATPLPSNSDDELLKLFSQCGQVTKVMVIESETKFPSVVKGFLSTPKKSFWTPLAIVEYAKAESAQKASKALTNTSDWRKGLKVEVLSRYGKKPLAKYKENKSSEIIEGADVPKNKPQKKKKKKKVGTNQPTEKALEDSTGNLGKSPIEGGCVVIPARRRETISSSPKHPSSLGSSPRTSYGKFVHHGKSPLALELDDDSRMRSNSFGPSGQGAWVPRRLQERNLGGSSSSSLGKEAEAGSQRGLLVGILRIPKVPGDDKGFKVLRTLS